MKELKIIGEIEGFDRILYDSPAKWDNFRLSVVDSGKAQFEVWIDQVDDIEKLHSGIISINNRIEQFKLSIEWSYGQELKYKILDIIAPSFDKDVNLLEIRDTLKLKDYVTNTVVPRKVPQSIPQVPLEARRWIQVWTECTKLNGYVEEQLRRHYLIIEELWQEFHHLFEENKISEKCKVKLIRDFVSHASCNNPDMILLIEHNLPSAVQVINGKKQVSFNRTVEHRNYISRFEVTSRKIARQLVNYKMNQIGFVSSV